MSVAVVGSDRMLRMGARQVRVSLGRAGIALNKQEGDEATPSGLMVLRRVLFRADRLAGPPRTELPREPIAPEDGWCDDPSHADYNRQVRLPHPARHRRLWRDDRLYDVIGVLGWNDQPPRRNRGSAIFLHVAGQDLAPTGGCVAMPLDDLLALLAEGMIAVSVADG